MWGRFKRRQLVSWRMNTYSATLNSAGVWVGRDGGGRDFVGCMLAMSSRKAGRKDKEWMLSGGGTEWPGNFRYSPYINSADS